MTNLLAHGLAAYAVLAAPGLGYAWYQRARKRIAAGVPDAKVKLYREVVAEQIITTAVVLAIWRGGVPAGSLGLAAPHSLAWTSVAILVIIGALVWSSMLLRPKAEKLRVKLDNSVGALIPDTHQERSWWAAVSVGAGVSEELCFRGFLLYYFTAYLPNMNMWEKVLLTSIFFGMGHIYQGWKPALGTGILGLVLAILYLTSGSLLLPIVIHAAVDCRVLLIFPAEARPGDSRSRQRLASGI